MEELCRMTDEWEVTTELPGLSETELELHPQQTDFLV